MRKSKFKQTMSMLLAVLMVFMSMNFSVFAEELNTQQTEPEIMTNDLADPAAEDPPAETSTDTEEQQAPASQLNDLTSPAANSAVEDESSLRAAIEAAQSGGVIEIGSYIELTSPLVITKAITLRGSGMFETIITKSTDSWTGTGDKSSGSLIVVAGVEGAVNIENMTVTGAADIVLDSSTAYGHGINVYRSNDVALKNVFSTDNSGAGLIVNGSTVNANYLMTADNGWYSVNVENSDDYKGVFNLSSDSVLGDTVQIKSDKGGVTINASGYKSYTAADQSIIWNNGDPSGFLNGKAYIQENDSSYKVFDTIQAAVAAAKNDQTVNLRAGEYALSDEVTIGKPITIKGGEGVTVIPAKDKNAFTINQNISGNITFDGVNIDAKNGYTAAQSAHGIQVLNSVKIVGSLTIQNAKMENLFYGVLTSVDGVANKANTIDNIKIDHVIFNNNLHKAFYTDNAKNVEITNSQFNNCATETNSGSSWYTRVACDINLKFNAYESVNVSSCTFDGVKFEKDHKDDSTTDNTVYSAALSVKARNDGSYQDNAASLKNVTLENNTFTNNDADLRLGEAGDKGALADSVHRDSLGTVSIKSNHFSNLVQNNNDVQYDASQNWWGSDTPDFTKLVSGKLSVYPYYDSNNNPVSAPIEVDSDGVKTQYATLAEAVTAAPKGATVTIKEDITVDAAANGAIQVTKPMTITADAGKKITTKGTGSVKLFNIAASDALQNSPVILDGLNVELSDDVAAELHVVQVTTPYTTIQDCNFTGQYVAGSNNVTRAICPNANNENLTVSGCTFTNIRQPGYFEGSGTLSNNTVTGTKGFVITAESDYTMTDNTFDENAVDIAIIPNNQTQTNYDAGKLSAANNGAVVENQIDRTLAQKGTFVVDPALAAKVAGDNANRYTLQKAVDGVKDESSTVKVAEGTYELDSKLNITKPLTLEGLGEVTITTGETPWTSTGDGSDAMLINIVGADGVTLKNLTVTGAKDITENGAKKASGSGINISEGANVTLEDITSKDNAACGVIVNSSTVTATNLNTSGNAWGGVNVDKKTDNNAVFNLSGNSTLSEKNPIYSEKSAPDVTVNAETAEGNPYIATKAGDFTIWSPTQDLSQKVYTLDANDMVTIYPSIYDAVKADLSQVKDNTIYLGEGTYTLDQILHISGKSGFTIDGQGKAIVTASESEWKVNDNNNKNLITLNDCENVTIQNITLEKSWRNTLNIVNSKNIVLNDVTAKNPNGFNACVVINGSTVKAENLTTSGGIYGIDMASGSDGTAASLSLTGTGTIAQNTPIRAATSGRTDVTVDAEDAGGQYIGYTTGTAIHWYNNAEKQASQIKNKAYYADEKGIVHTYSHLNKVLENAAQSADKTVYVGEGAVKMNADVAVPEGITIKGTINSENQKVSTIDLSDSNKSYTLSPGKNTSIEDLNLVVSKPSDVNAAFALKNADSFKMANTQVTLNGETGSDYTIFNAAGMDKAAVITIENSSFDTAAAVQAAAVYTGDISGQRDITGKLTFTGNTINGNFASVLDQITGAYHISNNNANLAADDACLAGLSVVGSSWSNIQYGSVISNNTLITKNTHGTDALIRILPIRPGSRVQALPAVMQAGFVPAVENNTIESLPVYDVNMKRVNDNLCTLRLQGALTGSAIYTTYDNSGTPGKNIYELTTAPIMGSNGKLYDNLQTAVNEVGNGGTVTIPYTPEGYTYNGDLSIRDGITIEVAKGTNSEPGTAKINGQVVVDGAKNVIMNNISIEATTGGAAGTILTKQGASITVNDSDIVNNSTEVGSCGIRMEGEGDSVTLNRANVKAAKYYGIGVRNSNQNVTVNESTVTGWAAIMTSNGGSQKPADRNVTITVKDSQLYGYHASNNTASEGYGTVTLQENFEKVNFTAENTYFYAGVNKELDVESNGLYQNGLQVRSYDNSINLTDCQFEMENNEARVIHSHINAEGGEPYTEKAEATDNNKNTFAINGLTLVNPGTTDKKMIDARARFGGVKQDVFMFSGTNDLTEADIEWNLLPPTGDIIQIGSAEELIWVADQVNSGKDTFAGKTITLTDNIDLSSIENWTPIGIDDSQKAFEGTFDGGNYTISGLKVDTIASFTGLFGAVNGGAAIKDLMIDGAQIKTTGKNAGVLIGGTTYANQNSLTIENVNITNSQVEALGRVGGVIGWIKDSIKPVSISECSVNGSTISGINDTTGDEGDKVGGIVGVALGKTTITDCNVGIIAETTITGCRDVGGIIGLGQSESTIDQCNVGQSAKIKLKFINPIETFAKRDINVGVGGIVGTYLGQNALTLTNNVVNNAAEITADLTKYTAKSNIEVYKGRYFGAPRELSGKQGSIICNEINNTEITFYGKEDAAESGAVLKDIVENKAQAGDTVNLAKADYTSAEAITIDKSMTINGLEADKALGGDTAIGAAGQKTGVSVDAKLVITNSDESVMPVNLNGISVVTGTEKNHGVIEIPENSNPVNLTTDNCYLEQLSNGNGNPATNVTNVILSKGNKAATTINNTFISMMGTFQRGIQTYGDSHQLVINNSKIQGTEPATGKSYAYTRAVTTYGSNETATINNSEIDVAYYGLTIGNEKGTTISIANSKITAWAPLYIFDTTAITVKDSDLIGRTFAPGISNNFGVIVFEDAKDCTLDMTGGSVTSSYVQLQQGNEIKKEALVSFSNYTQNNKNNKVTFKGTALKVDEGANTPRMFDNINLNNGCTVEVDNTSTMKYGENDAYQVLDNNTDIIRNGAIDIGYAVGAAMDANVGTADTVSIPSSITQIDEALDMTQASNINFQVNGDLAVNGAFTGNSGQSKLILANGADVTFANTVKNFTTINVKNMPQDAPSVITAGIGNTDDNSFVKGNVSLKVALSEDGTQRTWTTEHRTDGFDKGNGTEAYPFTIATPEQLTVLAQKIEADEKYTVLTEEKAYAHAYYQLTSDITVDTWTPIGKTNAFNGHFDGNGYSIIGNGTTSALFGTTSSSAVIEKLNVTGSFLQMVTNNGGTIENSSAMFVNRSSSAMTSSNAGKIENSFTNSTKGLTANGTDGTVANSFYTADITDLTAHTYTNEDMQKARFAIKLNGKQPIDEEVNGVWGYNLESSAYPVINTDRVSADITPLENTIIVISSDEAVGTAGMSHSGLTHVYANDLINLKAEVKNEAYAFDGWYLGDSKDTVDRISRDSETNYQVSGPITLTARFNALPTRNVMAMTFQSDRGNVQVGDGAVGTASQQDVIYGKTTTIKATAKTGYKFAYWTTFSGYITNPANPEVVNTNAEWTLPLSTDAASYVAMFEENTKCFVTFLNSNGSVLDQQKVESGSTTAVVPADPTMPDQKFEGWNYNGKTYTVDEVRALFQKGVTRDMTFTAVYSEVSTAKYTVTAQNGTVSPQQEKYAYNDLVTVSANKAEEGKTFEGWRINNRDGSIISLNPDYTFRVTRDIILVATYTDNPEEQEATVLLSETVTQTEQGSGFENLYKLRFDGQIILPNNWTKVECGLVIKKVNVENQEDLEIGKDGVLKGKSSTQNSIGQFAINVTKLEKATTVSARSYLICLDANGTEHTVYSDMVKGIVQ